MATVAPAVRERPILMSGPMVRAILSGRKTQTRRVVKPQPVGRLQFVNGRSPSGEQYACEWVEEGGGYEALRKCPCGRVGDRLWVKETWIQLRQEHWHNFSRPMKSVNRDYGEPRVNCIAYRAGCTDDSERCRVELGYPKWKPSIHMPRWASRLTLEITEIRVERLAEITEADAKAEGMQFHDGGGIGHSGWRWCRSHGVVYPTCRSAFGALWESINGVGSVAANPWVWCISFCPVQP